MDQSIEEWTKSILWKTALKISDRVISYPFKFFKGRLTLNLLSPSSL